MLHLSRLPDIDYQSLDLLDQRVEKEICHVSEQLTLSYFGPETQDQKTVIMRLQLFNLQIWVHFNT